MKRVRVRIYGNVQGVFFRDSCRGEAARLGVSGWVSNEPDGSVAVEIEGEPTAVDELVGWCRTGSRGARVERVDVNEISATGEGGFEVR